MEKSHIVKLPMFQVSQIDSWKTLKPYLVDPCLAIVTWELSYINIWLSFISLISEKKWANSPTRTHPLENDKVSCTQFSFCYDMLLCGAAICAQFLHFSISRTEVVPVNPFRRLWKNRSYKSNGKKTYPILKNVCIFHAIYCGHLFEYHAKNILILLLSAKALLMVSCEAEVIPSVYI